MKRPQFPRSPIHTALWIDAAFELVAGAVLAGLRGSVAGWMDVDATLVTVAGVLFLVAAVAIGGVALRVVPARGLVTGLAALNLIGGVAIWCVLPFSWSEISAEGRWMASAIADSFIAVAALEFLALRRTNASTGPTG